MGTLWAAEPIVISLLGSGALWGAVDQLLAAFGHPLTPAQSQALMGLCAVVAAIVARSRVTAPDTLASIKSANQQGGTP